MNQFCVANDHLKAPRLEIFTDYISLALTLNLVQVISRAHAAYAKKEIQTL